MQRFFDRLRSDLHFAIRALRRRPGFTAIATFTLAIGIGATTAIFSVIYGVLLKPLPYADPDGLVNVGTGSVDASHALGNMSFPDLADIRDQSQAFETLVGYGATSFTLTGRGEPEMVSVSRVTEGLMQTFRVAPLLGRDIRRDEFGANAPNVAVLSYSAWVERFGSDRNVIGQTVQLNSATFEIVGVAPAGFDFPGNVMFWVPRQLSLENCGRGCHTFNAIGRLAGAATLATVRAELDRFATNFETAYPRTNTGKRFVSRELKESVVGGVKSGLWMMLAAVALVLLIACANVANLLLARASAREGETAVRSALGASRTTLARQVFTESAALSLLGGTLGVVLAFVGVRVLRAYAEGTIPRASQIEISTLVLLVTLGTVVFVTIAFSLIPALTLSRASLAENMSQIGRGGGTARRTMRFRRALLAGEVALSAALLIGAGLLLKTFAKLYAVDVGYEKQEIVRFRVTLPTNDYPELERISQFYQSLESRIAQLPGVQAVGSMFGAPLAAGQASGSVLVEGRPEPQPSEEKEAQVRPITPGMMQALGLRLVRGRPLTDADNRRDAEPVALVNESIVRQHFPNEEPLGKRIRVSVNMGFGSPYWRIVGVVRDGRFDALTSGAVADIFMPHAQFGPNSMTIHVRTVPGALLTQNTLREAVRALDPNVALFRYEAIEEVIGQQVAPTRLYLLLVAAFAMTAAALAAVGLFGIMSYVVAQRAREIGIRVALGSQRSGVVGLIVRQGMQPVLIGVVAGAAAALVGGRFIAAVLFGVEPTDPVVFSAAGALMILVALAAAAVPAARASAIDPARVLHGE